uniref:Uncharacterized protein n=1 Tax=Meloidogyne enterolobii TaxID=390850 RepID=A0A6V7USU3_MELEN|nr:unnamed protein product [Meloidogyne enterolobii]
MFLRVDSLIDKDLEDCISVGIGELNFLYYLINIKKMVAKEEFNLTDKLTNINEQLDIIRTTHQDIFSTLIAKNLEFLKRYEKIEEKQEIGKLMYDILIPVSDENLENEYVRCPEDDKDITYKEETQLIREYLTEPKDVHIKLINASSLALHYEIKIKEIIKPFKDSKLRTKIIADLLRILKIKDPKEKLCRLYFILDGDIKKLLNYEDYHEWSDYLKEFELKLYASGPTLESTMYSKENIDINDNRYNFLV